MTRPVSSTKTAPRSSASVVSITLTALTVAVTIGTLYSVIFNTALNTSDPIFSSLPTRQDGQTTWLAQKSNFLNVTFVKKAWGWTTAAFLALFLTSPPTILQPTRRLARWGATTLVWLAFTSWFFGPSLFDRVITASGGQCVIHVPANMGASPGPNANNLPSFITIPENFCRTRAVVTPAAFQLYPEILNALAAAVPSLVSSTSPSGPAAKMAETDGLVLETLRLKPRLYRGHDVSGHLFLLSLSILFLVDQLSPSLALLFPSVFASPTLNSPASPRTSVIEGLSPAHSVAVFAAIALTGLWFVMAVSTSVFFHTPWEKASGFGRHLDPGKNG
jgi:hypothetical protein